MADSMNPNANPAAIQEYLGGLDFPATKQELIDQARNQDAPQDVMSVLEQVDDGEYESPTDVSRALEHIA